MSPIPRRSGSGHAAEPSPRDGSIPDPVRKALLREAARAAARSRALAPSRPRGAALLTRSGLIEAEPEIEDPGGDGVGTCAERAVLYRALAEGRRGFRALVTRGAGGRDAGPPCGACLQVLLEFAPRIRLYWGPAGRSGGCTPAELLPGAFTGAHLRKDGR